MFVRNQGYLDVLDVMNNIDVIVEALSAIEAAALPIIEHLITDICIDRQDRYIYMRFL